jgi:hypothetical protein
MSYDCCTLLRIFKRTDGILWNFNEYQNIERYPPVHMVAMRKPATDIAQARLSTGPWTAE